MTEDETPQAPKTLELDRLPTATPTDKAAFSEAGLADVSITLTVELGTVRMTVGDARALRQGEIISLETQIGEPMDIKANGRLLARGEVVAIDAQRYGVRVVEVAGRPKTQAKPG